MANKIELGIDRILTPQYFPICLLIFSLVSYGLGQGIDMLFGSMGVFVIVYMISVIMGIVMSELIVATGRVAKTDFKEFLEMSAFFSFLAGAFITTAYWIGYVLITCAEQFVL